MKMRLLQNIHLALILTCLLCIPASAFAQDDDPCNNLDANEEWTTGFKAVNLAVQGGDDIKAWTQTKKLSQICEKSPTLNYIQGKIAEKLDQKAEALFYYQKASEYTYYFAVDPDVAKKFGMPDTKMNIPKGRKRV